MSVLSKISSALVVEDNILLAGQMREFLTELGCQETRVATTLEKALLEIDCGIQFAVLDVAIKDDGCSPLADRLETLGIPSIYFTGYRRQDFPDLPGAPWVCKPASETELLAAVTEALGQSSTYSQPLCPDRKASS